jgi:hypothetical protein
MKTKFYTLTMVMAFMIFPVIMNGQEKQGKDFNKGFFLGLKAGIDLSSLSNVDVEDPAKMVQKLGFQGGLVAKAGFNPYLALQMELLFAQKGMKLTVTESGITAKVWTNINYLEIPLLLKASIPLDPVFIYANVGPSLGIGLSAKLATDPDLGLNQTIKFEENGFQRLDFGVVFGGGVGVKLGNGELFLDLRYTLGISDVNNVSDATKEKSDYESNSNRNIGIAIGYLLKLGK